jgi:phage shock protein PspC (stress-responsive transcriptional regulator)
MNLSDEIKRLHELHQAGALSDAEFEQAKARVLSAAPASGATSGPRVNLNKGDGTLCGELSSLRRSRTDRWLGGVCGGLALASGVDSWVWRLVFVLFTCTFGFGIAIYLLLWIFVPEE